MSKKSTNQYSVEDLIAKLNSVGLKSKSIDKNNKNYRQLDEGTTIQIRVRTLDYAIHATKDMYSKLLVTYQPQSEIFEFSSVGMDKDEINAKINACKEERHNGVIFIFEGNKNSHPRSPKYQPHEIIVNSNTALDKVISIMAEK